jgi:hypothetical protein
MDEMVARWWWHGRFFTIASKELLCYGNIYSSLPAAAPSINNIYDEKKKNAECFTVRPCRHTIRIKRLQLIYIQTLWANTIPLWHNSLFKIPHWSVSYSARCIYIYGYVDYPLVWKSDCVIYQKQSIGRCARISCTHSTKVSTVCKFRALYYTV